MLKCNSCGLTWVTCEKRMQKLRSFFFDFVFYVFTGGCLTVFLPFCLILPRFFAKNVCHYLAVSIIKFLDLIVGLKIRVHGLEHILNLKEPIIIACQHQSALDTLLPSYLFDEFTIVSKKELFYIPVFGLYLWKLRYILIDRKQGTSALKMLITKAKKAFSKGRSVFIYPEGTRSSPENPVKCQAGVYFLYQGLNSPVLPIALNSGYFWGRKSFIKKPGIVDVYILPPIQPGLNRVEFLKTLEAAFEENSKP